jgi:SAM-dependent methyltransferase
MSEPTTRRPVPVTGHEQDHLPPMGREWLLPLYDPLTRLAGVRSVHRHLLRAAGLRPGHRVLEIGCGTGNLALLAASWEPAATVVGLDPDLAALARARRKARRQGVEVQWDRGWASDLPYPDACFDRVFSSLMLHHVPAAEKQQTLREVARVLRPGGELHLCDVEDQGAAHRGPLAHRLAGDPRTRDQLGGAVPGMLREAGFSEVGTDRLRLRFGLVLTSHRAVT